MRVAIRTAIEFKALSEIRTLFWSHARAECPAFLLMTRPELASHSGNAEVSCASTASAKSLREFSKPGASRSAERKTKRWQTSAAMDSVR